MLIKKILILTLFSFLFISCRGTSTILNIEHEPFSLSSTMKPNLTKITNNIVQAGDDLGWRMAKIKPGHIVATLYLRKHMAKVDIKYSNDNYSITYKDSRELKHKGNSIHPNYNGWVQNLSNAISIKVYNSAQK
ncbi:MAG: hypothetical protein R8L53_08385 [Mariprofundales bacterium]